MKRLPGHILVIGIICPLIGGTLVGYCSYLNQFVSDLDSTPKYFGVAFFGVLIFGMIITLPLNILTTVVSFFLMTIIFKINGTVGRLSCILVSTGTCFFFAACIRPIATDIDTTDQQLFLSAAIASCIGGLLLPVIWKRKMRNCNHSTQPNSP